MPKQEVPPVLTVREAAKYIRVSEKAIRDMARDGRIPAQKAGREWRLLKSALDEWLMGKLNRVAESPSTFGSTHRKRRNKRS